MLQSFKELAPVVVSVLLLCAAAYSAGFAHRGYMEQRLQQQRNPKLKIEWGKKE